MKPVILGAVVAIAVAFAFVLSGEMDEFDEPGPAQSLGQKFDKAAQDIKRKLDEKAAAD